VPLDGYTLPAVVLHDTVLPANGLPPEVRVAVRLWEPPIETLKLEGEIERVVDATPTFGPEYVPLVGSLAV